VIRVLIACLALGSLAAAEDAARDALAGQQPPWYDAQSDGWRRIDVPAPDRDEPVFDRNEGGVGLAAFDASGLAWILVAALAAALAVLAWRLLQDRRQMDLEQAPATAATPAARVVHLPFAADAGDPEAALRAALAAGDWARAAVWIYARTLLALDRAQVIRLDPGATNRSHLGRIAAWAGDAPDRRDHADAVRRIVAAFEAVYFGRRPIDRETVERLDRDGRAAIGAGP
jgi:hypothetical protein